MSRKPCGVEDGGECGFHYALNVLIRTFSFLLFYSVCLSVCLSVCPVCLSLSLSLSCRLILYNLMLCFIPFFLQFVCGLSLCCGSQANLSRNEIQKFVDHYKTDDGRVRYQDFCDAMENGKDMKE